MFIDSTVFVHHYTGVSDECRRFLARCERGELTGLTSVAVLAEVTHRLMTLEAVSRKLVSPGSVARKLAERPEVVTKLSTYQRSVEAIVLMNVTVEPVGLADLLNAHELRARHGLLTNDSLVAQGAIRHAGGVLASADAAFEGVGGLKVHAPRDLAEPPPRRKG